LVDKNWWVDDMVHGFVKEWVG